MTAYQICVPAENKPGMLARVTDTFARAKINLRAITITSFGGSGFFHMVVDDPQAAHTALTNAGIENHLKEVVAVLIEDTESEGMVITAAEHCLGAAEKVIAIDGIKINMSVSIGIVAKTLFYPSPDDILRDARLE